MYKLFPLLAVLLAVIHLFASKKPRTPLRITEILLVYLLALTCGIGGLYAFMGHIFASDAVAQAIGWPTGSPFQLEVGVANLSFGILGILCIFFRGLFPFATAIGYSTFLLGAACVHMHDIHVRGNLSELNSGAFLYVQDFFVPLFLLGLSAIYAIKLRQSHLPA
jgi:hypothetical protein